MCLCESGERRNCKKHFYLESDKGSTSNIPLLTCLTVFQVRRLCKLMKGNLYAKKRQPLKAASTRAAFFLLSVGSWREKSYLFHASLQLLLLFTCISCSSASSLPLFARACLSLKDHSKEGKHFLSHEISSGASNGVCGLVWLQEKRERGQKRERERSK